MKRAYRRILKTAGIICLTPPVLLSLLCLLLYLPPVQRWAINRAGEELSATLGLKVSVEEVAVTPFFDLQIAGLTAIDVAGDTILRAERLTFDVPLRPILQQQKVVVSDFLLEGTRMNTKTLIPDCQIRGRVKSLSAWVDGVAWAEQLVNIRRAALDGADLRITLADTAEKDTTPTSVAWKILADEARITHSKVQLSLPPDSANQLLYGDFAIGDARARQGHFDIGASYYAVQHFSIAKGRAVLGNFSSLQTDTLANIARLDLAADSISCDSLLQAKALLRTLAVSEEHYGIRIDDAHGRILTDTCGLRLPDFAILTPHSRLGAQASVDWSSLEADGMGHLQLRLQAVCGRADMAAISQQLVRQGVLERSLLRHPAVAQLLRSDVLADVSLRGNRRCLTVDTFELRLPRLLSLRATATARDDADRIEAHILAGAWGGTLAARAKAILSQEKYEATGYASRLPLARLVPTLPIGPLTGKVKVAGRGFDPLSPRTVMQADVALETLKVADYRLHHLAANATIQHGRAAGSMDVASSVGNVCGTFDANLSGGYAATASVEADSLDLQRLAGTEKPIFLHTKACLSGSSTRSFSQFAADGSLTQTYIETNERSTMFRDVSFQAASAADSTWAAIHTGDLALQFSSAANWQVLNRHTQTFLAEATRQLSEKRLENDTLRHLLPELVLDLQAGRDNPVIKYLAFKGTDLAGIDLHLRTNATEGLHGYARLGTIATSSLQLDTVYSVISHDSVGINFHTTFHNYKRSNPHRFTAVMDASIQEEQAAAALTFTDERGRKGIDLALEAEMMKGDDESEQGFRFSIHPETPIIAYRHFKINSDNAISINRQGMIHADVRLVDDAGMGLSIYGEPTEDNQNDITLSLSSIDLSALSEVLPYLPQLGGMAEGDFHVIEQHGDSIGLSAMGSVSVRDLSYEGHHIGNVGTEVVYLPKSGGEHYADAFISFDDQDVGSISAVYHDQDGSYQGDVALTDFPLAPINVFLEEAGFGLRGLASGNLSLAGDSQRPRLSGTIDLNDAHFYSPVYGVDFLMDERPLTFADSRLHFKDYLLKSGNTDLRVNGDIDFADLEDIRLDFRLRASDFELINARRNNNSLVYGKVLADFDGSAQGTLSNMIVRGNLDVLSGTDATYLLSNSPLTVEDRLSDLVTFVSFEDSTASVAPEEASADMAIDMSLDINISQGAKFHCFLSRNGESYVDIRGGGDLTFRMTPQGVMRLTGNYTIEEGEMKYELPVIPLKTFRLEQGSYVEFTGDMLNPRLSIRATEATKATVTENDVQRKVNFNVGVEISRTLMDMGLAFTIEAPEDLSVQNELMAMSAEDRNKTAVALLATGMYVTDNLAGGFKASNALNAFLQSEIQNIAGKALQTIDLSFGMENGTSATGGTTTDYSFQFSKRFLDDRISVKIGGSVQTGADAQNSAASFIDNISLEYRLDNSGTRYVRIFYDREAHDPLEGSMMNTGAGMVLRRKTDRLSELFIFRRNKKKNEQP